MYSVNMQCEIGIGYPVLPPRAEDGRYDKPRGAARLPQPDSFIRPCDHWTSRRNTRSTKYGIAP